MIGIIAAGMLAACGNSKQVSQTQTESEISSTIENNQKINESEEEKKIIKRYNYESNEIWRHFSRLT